MRAESWSFDYIHFDGQCHVRFAQSTDRPLFLLRSACRGRSNESCQSRFVGMFDKNRSTDKDKESNFVNLKKGKIMAAKAGSAESVYKIVEVIGTSTKSWDDAAKNAVETAAGALRDLRIAEIVKLDMKVEDGKVQAYRARVMLSFKYES